MKVEEIQDEMADKIVDARRLVNRLVKLVDQSGADCACERNSGSCEDKVCQKLFVRRLETMPDEVKKSNSVLADSSDSE